MPGTVWWTSLKAKVFSQVTLLSAPLLLFGYLTIQQSRQAATATDLVFNRNAAVSSAASNALAKLAEARYHAANNDQAAFESSAADFDLLMKSMAWGTDSDLFRRDKGGELYKRWSEAGWQKSIGEVKTSDRIRQRAGETAFYYQGFSKYMLQAMTLSDPLNLLLDPAVDEALKKANKYERLVVKDLQKLLDDMKLDTRERRAALLELRLQQIQRSFYLAVAMFILVMISTWILSMRDIVRPIVRLTAEVEKVRTGDLTSRLTPRSQDEIGQLTRAFNLMTEQLQTMTVSRDYMNSVLEASPLGFVLTDEKGDNLFSNAAFLRILGLKENLAAGKGWVPFIHPDDRERVRREWTAAVKERRGFDSTHRFSRGESTIWVRVIAAPMVDGEKVTGYVGTVEDITQQKDLESTVRQSEKMVAVGQLAGGIAHDLNNGLTPVMGYLDLLLLDASEKTAVMLNEAKQSTQRCADVVRQLLSFSRPTAQVKTELPVSRLCQEFRRLAHTILPTGITVNVECALDIGSIKANETDLMNMLMNLALNAKDAMHSKGSLTVTALRGMSAAGARPETGSAQVLISVTDTGKGIPQADIAHIFEPFFTTKAKGKGTGLGLAMVYNTVKEHDGSIQVSSIEGQGTTFQITLPLSSGAAADHETMKDAGELPRGSGLILLVDDEEAMRSMGKRFLEHVGYRVVLAADGDEAVETFSKGPSEFKAVVMDITMPKMSGIQAMKKMLTIDPKARILLVSGYTSEGTPQELIKAGAAGFLNKPFTIGPFTRMLHEVLAK